VPALALTSFPSPLQVQLQAHGDVDFVEVGVGAWLARALAALGAGGAAGLSSKIRPSAYDPVTKRLRLRRLKLPSSMSSLGEIVVKSLESGFGFVIQLLVSLRDFVVFMCVACPPTG
jgi:hypothetical protein